MRLRRPSLKVRLLAMLAVPLIAWFLRQARAGVRAAGWRVSVA
jgi:hypothetical protein